MTFTLININNIYVVDIYLVNIWDDFEDLFLLPRGSERAEGRRKPGDDNPRFLNGYINFSKIGFTG